MKTSNDYFVAALQKKLKEQGRGAKKKLAAGVGMSPNHLSDILGRRKNAGQKLKERISDALDINFEDMLVLGRNIIEGRQEKVSGDISGGGHSKGLKTTHEQKTIDMSVLLTMTAKILESNTPYRQALLSNITEYYQGLEFSQKKKKAFLVISEMQEEINTMRKEIDELKRTKEKKGNSPNSAAA